MHVKPVPISNRKTKESFQESNLELLAPLTTFLHLAQFLWDQRTTRFILPFPIIQIGPQVARTTIECTIGEKIVKVKRILTKEGTV